MDILTALIEYGEFIAAFIFLIFFLSNKKARKDFNEFWKVLSNNKVV